MFYLIYESSLPAFLEKSSPHLVLNLSQLVSRNEPSHLPPVPRHPLVDNRHLFRTECPATVDLYSKAAEDLTVHPTEPHTVVLLSVASSLLVSSLVGVEFHQCLDRPGGVGSQLVLEVGLGCFPHCGTSIDEPVAESSLSQRFF